MSKVIDVQCNVEFPSETTFAIHKKSNHKIGLEKAIPIELPPSVPSEAMPSKEFIEQVKRIESQKEQKPLESNPTASQHPSTLPPAQKVILTYKYSGECIEHRVPIDTLELDVDKQHFCIAFCPTGKHQIETRQVVKL